MTVTPIEFLDHVLPSEGYRVTWGLRKKQNIFHTSNHEALRWLYQNDTSDVFFGCAAYAQNSAGLGLSEGKGRTQENAISMKALWLDLDCGTGKPYISPKEAGSALVNFSQTTGLPFPTLVKSGGGLHAWWSLTSPISNERWKQAAILLGNLCEKHGLKVDPARTSDQASILRVPGTRNWKLGPEKPREVTCARLEPAVDTETFLRLLQSEEVSKSSDFLGGIKQAPDFLRGYRDGERTDALLHRAGFCLGPRKMAVEDAIETCLRWNDHNLPPLDEAKVRTTVANIAAREGTHHAPQVKTIAQTEMPKLPEGYRWGGQMQLLYEQPSKDETPPKIIKISTYPIYVENLHVRPSSLAGTAVGFRYWLPDRGWSSFSLPVSAIKSGQGAAPFADFGPNILSWPHFQHFVERSIDQARAEKKELMIYEQFGWDEERNFLLGNTLYKPDGSGHEVPLAMDIAQRSRVLYKGRKITGSWEGWSSAANYLFGIGYEAQSFGVLATAASPIMELVCPPLIRGAILSYVTPTGGKGKTTTLLGVSTFWGAYDAMRVASGDTQNATFRSIAMMNSLPVIFDEFRYGDPQRAVNFLVNYTTGKERQRLGKDGNFNHKDDTWRNILVTASNTSLVDTILASGSDNAAMANRILEMPLLLPEGTDNIRGDRLQQDLQDNAGYAGALYMRYLMQPDVQAFIIANADIVRAKIKARIKGANEDRFYECVLTSMVFANMIIKKLGLLEYDFNRVLNWGIGQINDINAGRLSGKTSNLAVDSLVKYMNQNMNNAVIVDGPHMRGKNNVLIAAPKSGKVFMRIEVKGNKAYIEKSEILQGMVTRYPIRQLAAELQGLGVVKTTERRITLGGGTDYSAGQSTAWEIDLAHPAMTGFPIGELTIENNVVQLPRQVQS